ncbi:MAG: hypothetical protein E7118_02395 [Bacteroidales bacterium]|nr:hypothetical protein [Bacteroidales bacterium]
MGKVVFPFDSYVSPLYDSSVKGWLQGVWGYEDFDPLAFDLHSCRLRVDDYQRLIEEVRRGMFRR